MEDNPSSPTPKSDPSEEREGAEAEDRDRGCVEDMEMDTDDPEIDANEKARAGESCDKEADIDEDIADKKDTNDDKKDDIADISENDNDDDSHSADMERIGVEDEKLMVEDDKTDDDKMDNAEDSTGDAMDEKKLDCTEDTTDFRENTDSERDKVDDSGDTAHVESVDKGDDSVGMNINNAEKSERPVDDSDRVSIDDEGTNAKENLNIDNTDDIVEGNDISKEQKSGEKLKEMSCADSERESGDDSKNRYTEKCSSSLEQRSTTDEVFIAIEKNKENTSVKSLTDTDKKKLLADDKESVVDGDNEINTKEDEAKADRGRPSKRDDTGLTKEKTSPPFSPFKLKIKLGPNKSGELVSHQPRTEETSRSKKRPSSPQIDDNFHGFSDEEIPMFVFNNFDNVDLKNPIRLKPTMFVSISSKKKQPEKPSLPPALNLSGPQPSPKTFQKVRFADEVPVKNQEAQAKAPEPTTPSTPQTQMGSGKKSNLKFWNPLYDGWMREIVVREDKSNPAKTRKDVYYHSPQVEGKPSLKFKNSNELEGHLITSGSMYPLTFFTFRKEPLGAPEPMEVIRDASSTKSPAKPVSVDAKYQMEKRVSKNPERLINEQTKDQHGERSGKKSAGNKETKSDAASNNSTTASTSASSVPEVRTSKRVIKPPEKLDPLPSTPQQAKKKVDTQKAGKTDPSGLWKDSDNIMSPKKSVTTVTTKPGTGLLKVKMFSKLNAKNVSEPAIVKSCATEDDVDETGILDDEPLLDPLHIDLSYNDSIAVSDEDDIKIEEEHLVDGSQQLQQPQQLGRSAAVDTSHLPLNIAPVVPSAPATNYTTQMPKVVSVSSLRPSLTIQRSVPQPPLPSNPPAVISITPLGNTNPMYPNMSSAPEAFSNTSIQPQTILSMSTTGRNVQKIYFPTRKTLLPCSIHCPGATGFPSLSCKSCHCLFHPKCVGLSGTPTQMLKNGIFYCNDCRNKVPESEYDASGTTISANTPTTTVPPVMRIPVSSKRTTVPGGGSLRIAPRPVMKIKTKASFTQPKPGTSSVGTTATASAPTVQPNRIKTTTTTAATNTSKPPEKASRPRGNSPPRPIEHQTMVNIGGKKFLVIPRDDLGVDSPPPSPPLVIEDDKETPSTNRKLPCLLRATDGAASKQPQPDFEVEQAFDGNIIIKPIGNVDPVKVFGINKLKRPLPDKSSDKSQAKKQKFDFNSMHSSATEGYFALLHVFKYLTVQDRLQVGRVCRLWHQIAKQRTLWESMSLKNMKVTDWSCFASFVRKVGCESVDMRKMVFVKDRDVTWTDILANLASFQSLKQLQLPRIAGNVLVSIVKEMKGLEILNAPLVISPLDTSAFKSFTRIRELRLKTGSGQLVLENGLQFLESLAGTLTSLSLLTMTGLTEADYDSIGILSNLEQIELGDCTHAPITLFKTLSDLSKLSRIRLEKGTVSENISKLERGDNLRQLELIDFHVEKGFKEGLKGLDNIRKLLIIPNYKDEVASSNTEILEGITSHLKHLDSFYLGVTNEWLQAMSVVIGDHQKSKAPGDRECFPLEKEGKVEYISLPGLYRKVCREMPSTKVKVLKMSAGATCKQFIKSLDK